MRLATPRTVGLVLALALLGSVLPSTAGAMLVVRLEVTPAGGNFDYEITVENGLADDLAIVSLADGPLGDALLEATLTGPAGYVTSYDGGLGFVDLLADSEEFSAGTTVGGFFFTSASAPGPGVFESFEALTVLGDQINGTVTLVPEPSLLLLLFAALALLSPAAARASSHSDAPLIKQDPQANLTDVYAFIGTKFDDTNTKVLNVIASVRPFSDPGDGVVYDRFAADALYSIHITQPSTGATVDRYDFRFSSVTGPLKNPNAILSYGLGTELGPIQSIGDLRQNHTQSYTISRNGVLLGTGLVPPPNVGLRTTPGYNDATTGKALSGATTPAQLDPLTLQGVRALPNGFFSFAGPREDGFYADTPGIFDLLDPRILDNNGNTGDGLGQDGNGVDGFKGFNVLSYGIQIPLGQLTTGSYTDPIIGTSATGVGVYASVSRPRIRLLTTTGAPVHSGPWIQVNRLGNPLFNETLVALKDKDKYNRTAPTGDAQFATYALNPELARLINFVLFSDPQGDGPLPVTGRSDLAAIFIPDVVRVDTTTAAVLLPGQAGFSRFGALGGDTTAGSGGTRSGGWPNGRRIGDDVVDITLSLLSQPPTFIGDNTAANDQLFNQVFPYLGTPHAGPTASQRQSP